MLGVVLPGAVFAPDLVVDVVFVVMVYVFVVYVDVDVIVTPAATVAPAPVSPDCSDRDSNAKGKSRPSHVRSVGWIVHRRIRIGGLAVNYGWVVGRDVNHFGVRRLNDDNALAVHLLSFDRLLLAGFESSRALGLGAHALDRVHHIGFLREESVSQLRGPSDIIAQLLDHVGHYHHGLDAGVPRLFFRCIGQRLALQVLILSHPLLELNDLERVGGSDQRLA